MDAMLSAFQSLTTHLKRAEQISTDAAAAAATAAASAAATAATADHVLQIVSQELRLPTR